MSTNLQEVASTTPTANDDFTKTEWQDIVMRLGYADAKRKRGNEHSLRGLAGAYETGINVIIVSQTSNSTVQYNPPPNIPHTDEIWLIYLSLPHTGHYLSTTKIGLTRHELTSARDGEAAGNAAEIRRASGSMESPYDLALEAISGPRILISTPTLGVSQGTPQVFVSANIEIFANIQHVPGDFVHRLYQHGAFMFIYQTFIDGNLWKPRDCRVRRTAPSEESCKEFTKCLKLILPLAQLFPTKPLERELLCSVAKRLPFFIFPPTRIRRKHQKILINRAKKFQEGKWEELWKQSMREYEIEREHREHIQPPKQKSILEKDRQAQFFHKFGAISKASKVLTSEMKHTGDHRTRYAYKIYSPYQAKTTKVQSNYITIHLTTGPRMMRYLKFRAH
jgi:hypothetical protein